MRFPEAFTSIKVILLNNILDLDIFNLKLRVDSSLLLVKFIWIDQFGLHVYF
jgi:hypothetical protein